MANLNLDENRSRFTIRAYTPGDLFINDTHYHESLILTPTELIHPWPVPTIADLTLEHLQLVLPYQPTILLIGTGDTMTYLSPTLYGDLINAGIGVEFMSTRAACRTYNALASEDRNVAAALIIR